MLISQLTQSKRRLYSNYSLIAVAFNQQEVILLSVYKLYVRPNLSASVFANLGRHFESDKRWMIKATHNTLVWDKNIKIAVCFDFMTNSQSGECVPKFQYLILFLSLISIHCVYRFPASTRRSQWHWVSYVLHFYQILRQDDIPNVLGRICQSSREAIHEWSNESTGFKNYVS